MSTNQSKAHSLQNKIASTGTENLSDNEITQLTQLLSTISLSKKDDGSSNREPKVNDPKIFNGSNSDGDGYNRLENFLTQLNMVFKLQPSRFPDEETKVIYAASFMDKIAFEWIQPYINAVGTAQEDPIATNFSQFTAAIRRMFGDVTLISDAENKVMKMKQGNRSASEYTTEFKRYAGLTNFNEDALFWAYKNNINAQIQDELVIRSDTPNTLIEYQDLVIKLDMLFRERNNKHYRSNNNNNRRNVQKFNNNHQVHLPTRANVQHQTQHVQENDGDVSPMEIDNVSHKNHKKKYITLSKTEKQRRKDLDLCAYCGSPDHQVNGCDVLPPTSKSINAAYYLQENPPKKGNTQIFTFQDFLNTQSQ